MSRDDFKIPRLSRLGLSRPGLSRPGLSRLGLSRPGSSRVGNSFAGCTGTEYWTPAPEIRFRIKSPPSDQSLSGTGTLESTSAAIFDGSAVVAGYDPLHTTVPSAAATVTVKTEAAPCVATAP